MEDTSKRKPRWYPWLTMNVGDTFTTPYIASSFCARNRRVYTPRSFKAYQRKKVFYVERVA